MTENALLQIVLYFLVLGFLVKPLGLYMAQVYENTPCLLTRLVSPFERLTYRLCGIDASEEMDWKRYLSTMLIFNLLGLLAVYALQRFQYYLVLNPQEFSGVSPDLAFNTAASFVTNTNWQAYGGESTLGYLTQMLALTVQNFLSAATGMSLLVALIRGISRHEHKTLGNFWQDTVRGTLYILLPMSFVLAVALSATGVIQNFKPYETAHLIESIAYQDPVLDANGQAVNDDKGNPKTVAKTLTEQSIPMGPVASQIAIKQLGTNGGGFFNANSAYPYENPTPFSNFLEMLAILLLPAALCYTYGKMVHDKRQGWALFAAMFIILIGLVFVSYTAEQAGNPAFTAMGIENHAINNLYPGGNMEGHEIRFGIVNSALWITNTTATSNGSVNAMIDSFMPLGGLVPLWLMHLGEVVFGGIGSGLYGMLMLVIITVFVAGLMVGRTPEYLGKKIEPYEMKMATVAVLVMPLFVLIFTAIAAVTTMGTSSTNNPGPHGFTEMLYGFSSMVNNNGSAFAGLNANTFFYNVLGGIGMLLGRYWIAIPTLALAGALVKKKIVPVSSGTLATHTLLFIILLICVTLILGGLSFLPALALGPIVEHLTIWGQHVH